jgi:hypothetical protein
MRKLFARFIACICAVVLLIAIATPSIAAMPTTGESAKLLISELQTGGLDALGNENGKLEFIELYNPDDLALDVTGWRLEYLSASHDGTGLPTRLLVALEGIIRPHSYVLVSYDGYIAGADVFFGAGSTAVSGLLARSGGHVRIVDALGVTIDLVGWGTGVVVGSWPRVAEIPTGQSVQRPLIEAAPAQGQGFASPSSSVTPQGGGLSIVPPPETEPDPGPDPDPEQHSTCDGLIITELLSNPSGNDTGKEYIELYNPTSQSIRTLGCSLRLGENGKAFPLPDELLAPQSYRAFFNSESGLTLPNSTAQTIWLVSVNSEQGVVYPAGLQNDQAWALKDDTWQRTMMPTPDLANTIMTEADDDGANEPTPQAMSPTACPSGKERNPDTNRCRNILQLTAAPTPCKPGTTRNPATGRCRSVLATASLAPCKPGQQRNVETNRCRSVLGSATTIKSCAAGQERNPQTNRCRKAQSGGKSIASIQDVRTKGSGFDARWAIVGALIAGAIGYALYEWRQEFVLVTQKLAERIRPDRRGG